MQNGTISLKVTPYVGTYDGKAHNAFTSVTTNPSDAKLEYSINGGTYSTTMPTIKDTSSFTVTVRASKVGYKTQSATQTVKVNKAAGTLTLSATSETLTYPTGTSFTVSGNTGTLSAVSNNTNIVTVSVSGNTVTVKPGTTSGKATITVTSATTTNYNAKSATYTATVKNGEITINATPYTGTYDGKVHNAFTSVTTNPSDAKLEYSINGGTYSTTMPTIKDTSSFTVTVRVSKTGYATKTATETVKVNKANGSLSLSSYSGTINYPNSTSFTASGTGSISAWSSNTGVATVSVSGNTVTVKSVGAGSATITVKSASNTNYNEKTATYSVTVKDNTFTGTSGVGYYADVDGNGTVDGIIFEDFKVGGSGKWRKSSYSIPTVSGTKNYYISQVEYRGPFGSKGVLTPNSSGNARFNVMALEDYNNGKLYSFATAKDITSGDWKTPTNEELIAFAGQLNITPDNYKNYGLSNYYWSSTVFFLDSGCLMDFQNGTVRTNSENIGYGRGCVRLTRNF